MFAVFLLFLMSLAGGSYLYWQNQDNVDTKIYDRYEFRVDGTSGDSSITVGTIPIANAEGGVIPSLAVQRASCPSGYTYNSANGMCEREVYTTSYSYVCSWPTSYNYWTGKCETQPTIMRSLPTRIEICPPDTYYDSNSGVCIGWQRKCTTIRIGFKITFDCRWKRITAAPTIAWYCPPGTSYHLLLGTLYCEHLSCPFGTSYNSWTRKCESAPQIAYYTSSYVLRENPTMLKSTIRIQVR